MREAFGNQVAILSTAFAGAILSRKFETGLDPTDGVLLFGLLFLASSGLTYARAWSQIAPSPRQHDRRFWAKPEVRRCESDR